MGDARLSTSQAPKGKPHRCVSPALARDLKDRPAWRGRGGGISHQPPSTRAVRAVWHCSSHRGESAECLQGAPPRTRAPPPAVVMPPGMMRPGGLAPMPGRGGGGRGMRAAILPATAGRAGPYPPIPTAAGPYGPFPAMQPVYFGYYYPGPEYAGGAGVLQCALITQSHANHQLLTCFRMVASVCIVCFKVHGFCCLAARPRRPHGPRAWQRKGVARAGHASWAARWHDLSAPNGSRHGAARAARAATI